MRRRLLQNIARRLGALLLMGVVGFVAVTAAAVVSLRWIDPPTSSFILQYRVSAWLDDRDGRSFYQEWVPWEAIAPAVPLAVVAAEDQRFSAHHGFDLVEIRNALQDYNQTGRLRGASTISQQLAKNLFLWPERSLLRKGLEGWLTLLIELCMSKRRILELYLNLAQFSEDTFGVGAASWRYFNRPAGALTMNEACRLAAVLPNPEHLQLNPPSAYVRKRTAQIREQAENLGAGNLDGL